MSPTFQEAERALCGPGTMSGKRLLEVTVVEARNVLGIESATASDTFATIKFLDIANRVIKNESGKTKTISGTLNPRWELQAGEDEKFKFGENYDMSNPDTLPTLVVSLFDQNTFQANTPMGCVQIPLDLVHDAGDAGTGQVWYPLQKDLREKMKASPRGDLMLEASRRPGRQVVAPGGGRGGRRMILIDSRSTAVAAARVHDLCMGDGVTNRFSLPPSSSSVVVVEWCS